MLTWESFAIDIASRRRRPRHPGALAKLRCSSLIATLAVECLVVGRVHQRHPTCAQASADLS